ncbi:MAG: Na(+)-translocating NADH-quinone reductase subunit A [Pirellulaceae bacterium]
MPRRIQVTKGLNLPIAGTPAPEVGEIAEIRRVALIGDDYIGMKPTMLVTEGDQVKLGQPLFEDKRNPGVIYTSPGAGTVAEVNRGAKRKFESIVIDLEGEEEETFPSFPDERLSSVERSKIQEVLVQSGLWTALRTRPYGKVPAVGSVPRSIFVTALDTNPLAADPTPLIKQQEMEFVAGLEALSTLTEGKVYLCEKPEANLPGEHLDFVENTEFAGPHPAGLPGTHIHFLDPAGPERIVWYIGYQDVIAIGTLLKTGRLDPTRIVSLAGPPMNNPRLVKARVGASVDDLLRAEGFGEDIRVISGSVFAGRHAKEIQGYLGRYHVQVSVLHEAGERELFGWMSPGFTKFSVKRVFASMLGPKQFEFTTSANGSHRAIVPSEAYEQVMPLDIEPTALVKALVVGDMENARDLGALELEEEDIALCTFVDTGKHDFGTILRLNLNRIEAEG